MEPFIVMFGIVLLIGAFYVLFRFVRYTTLQEAEKYRLAEKVTELEAKLAVKESPVVIGPSSYRDTEHHENAMFLLRSALTLMGYSSSQRREAEGKLEAALDELIEWRGLDKNYKTGDRDASK